jgi:hypothetical protein
VRIGSDGNGNKHSERLQKRIKYAQDGDQRDKYLKSLEALNKSKEFLAVSQSKGTMEGPALKDLM